jgi:hypothetical protein
LAKELLLEYVLSAAQIQRPARWTTSRAVITRRNWAPASDQYLKMKEHFGYTEPFRRFVQREGFEPQANEIRNTMPSWMPGGDHLTNFRVGDPYIKVDQGFARLPGAGYEAIHQELKRVNPEDYPDIHKLAILADVAPIRVSTTSSARLLRSSLKTTPGLSVLPNAKTLAHARQAQASL